MSPQWNVAVVILGFIHFVMARCNDRITLAIDFSNQRITHVDQELFKDCNIGAISIDLSGNKITQLNASAFAYYDSNSGKYIYQFYKLQKINLNNNQISSIDKKTFSYTRLLETLSLNNNEITSLESGIFYHQSYLEELDLSNNKISTIGTSVFTTRLSNLRIVDLSNNKLTAMEAWPYIPPDIVTFNVSHNQINRFTNYLNWTYDLAEPYHVYVDLKHNNFTIWDDEWLRRYQRLDGNFVGDFVTYRLDISLNPWVCDCQIHYMASKIQDSFYRYAESELLHVYCENPPNLRGQRIIDMDLNELICNVTLDCPLDCECKNMSASKTLKVDCHGGNLTQLPDHLPDITDRTIDLDVSNNKIWKIDSRQYIDKLNKLSAQNNRLVLIDQETIKNMTQHSLSMNISNNQLQFLPNSIQTVQIISIHNNPFTCACNMTWMAGWLDLESIKPRDKQVTCRTEDGDTHNIIAVTDTLLDCNFYTEIGLAIGFGILLVLVLIGLFWTKKCPYETKVLAFKFFRIHPRDKYKVDEEGTTKEHDIYISFDDRNVHIRQWVLKKLKKLLEEKEDAPKYQIFIPVIHLLPGQDKGISIIQTMENSKRIVIILSDKYDENEWSEFECQRAELLNPNDGRIIFIKYHPESEDMVLREPWKSRVKDRKVLAIGEKSSEQRWFWDKLRYELPVK